MFLVPKILCNVGKRVFLLLGYLWISVFVLMGIMVWYLSDGGHRDKPMLMFLNLHLTVLAITIGDLLVA